MAQVTRTKPPSMIDRRYSIRKSDISRRDRSVELSFSSETTSVKFAGIPQVLLHERGAIDLEPLREAGSVLLNHDANKVVARPENVRLDEAKRVARATAVFDDDAESDAVFRKILSGSLRGASVRANVDEWKLLDEGESWTSAEGRSFEGPLDLAVRWRVIEVSVTPTPADHSVGVGRSLEEGLKMANDEKTTMTKERPERETLRAERARVSEIRAIADLYNMPELADDLIAREVDVDSARGEILEALRARRPVIENHQRVDFGEEAHVRFKRDATDSLLARCGVLNDPAREASITHHSSLVELARASLHAVGVRDVGLHARDIVERALSHSVSDFPNILESAANKNLQDGFRESPATWRPVSRRVSVADFKARNVYKTGEFENLEETPDGAPMPEGSLPEVKESYSILTYAKRFGIGRKALVNDDLDALSGVPRSMGAAAARLINQLFWDLVVSASGVGPTMAEDSKALFATDHTSGANYTAGAGSPDVAGLGVGQKLMRRQKGQVASGTAPILNLSPAVLVVPAALEVAARQTVTSTNDPSTSNDSNTRNPFSGALEIVVEPRLDDATNGATAWYLVASPASFGGAEVAFLNGREAPSMIRVEGTNVLGVEWGAYLDVGAKFVEHRSWYRCRGA